MFARATGTRSMSRPIGAPTQIAMMPEVVSTVPTKVDGMVSIRVKYRKLVAANNPFPIAATIVEIAMARNAGTANNL
ncbi:hypothetical protein Are01nite_29500 [Actinoplanes regularis]|nr:hypothetical protein Are01nite_29500 [Actinoplanes regularis]